MGPYIDTMPFYGIAAVRELTGLTSEQIKKLVIRRRFPRPIPVMGGGRWVWAGSAVLAWREAQRRKAAEMTEGEVAEALKVACAEEPAFASRELRQAPEVGRPSRE